MKKIWTGFRLVMLLPIAAAAAGIVFISGNLIFMGLVLVFGGAVAAGWWYLYFKKLDYVDNGREIHIRSGVLIKKNRRLCKKNILWTNGVRLFGSPVLTVLHTGGGSMVVFAEAEFSEWSD